MNENTINNDVTMGGGANGALLAGRYRVIKQLGQGGMGSVWLAEDVKLDGHRVAIKMLPAVLVSNRRAYQQVKQEALVSLRLSHSSIVPVRAFEEDERGNPFLVMDYVDGRTLDDYLAEKGRLSEDEAVRLLKPVAAALDYAHAQGVVHRDVKPGNVMIRKDGTPFVLDFGIAREIQETLTRVTGSLSGGTLVYMSPEQLRGELPKSAQDVYSLAALAYECLKGEPPFSRGQVEYQILNEPPPPLPDGLRLARSVLRGLSKSPEARPGSCAGVLDSDSRAPRALSPAPRVENHREPDDPRTPSDSKAPLLWTLAALAAVVLGGVWWNGVRQQPEPVANGTAVQRSAVEAKVDAPEKVDMIELDKTRIEAQVQVAACRRLDAGDGFAAQVEANGNAIQNRTAERERNDGSPGGVQLWENGPYWAECNVGATKPEESGYYFWWGDTVGYTRNASNNGWVSVSNGTSFSFSSGNCPTCGKRNPELQSAGYIDSTGNLAAPHDAATVHLGKPWRMPTDVEWQALIDNCATTWTTRNGIAGRLVTGKGAYASKSIFLPAAGYGRGSYLYDPGSYGHYWSSTPGSGNSDYAWYLCFYSGYFLRNFNLRYVGRSVRPVRGNGTFQVPSVQTRATRVPPPHHKDNAKSADERTVSHSRLFKYEVILVPYLMVNGRRKNVDVDATCGASSVVVRSYFQWNQGSERFMVLVGSNTRVSGLVSVVMRTKDGRYVGRKWLNAYDLTDRSNRNEIEVELK